MQKDHLYSIFSVSTHVILGRYGITSTTITSYYEGDIRIYSMLSLTFTISSGKGLSK